MNTLLLDSYSFYRQGRLLGDNIERHAALDRDPEEGLNEPPRKDKSVPKASVGFSKEDRHNHLIQLHPKQVSHPQLAAPLGRKDTQKDTKDSAKKDTYRSKKPPTGRVAKAKQHQIHLYQLSPAFYSFAAVFFPMLVAVLVDFLNVRREADIIRNMTHVYTATTAMWTHLEILKYVQITALTHGDRYQVLGLSATQAMHLEIAKVKLITKRYTELLERDLGSYQNSYNYLFSRSFELCEDMKVRETVSIDRCGSGASAVFKNNVELVLHYVQSISKELIALLEQLSSNSESSVETVRIIWANPKVKALVSATSKDGVNWNIYYLVLEKLIIHMQHYLMTNQISSASSTSTLGLVFELDVESRLVFSFCVVYLLLSITALYYLVVKRIEAIFLAFNKTCIMLPWTLMMNNPLLSHHFND